MVGMFVGRVALLMKRGEGQDAGARTRSGETRLAVNNGQRTDRRELESDSTVEKEERPSAVWSVVPGCQHYMVSGAENACHF